MFSLRAWTFPNLKNGHDDSNVDDSFDIQRSKILKHYKVNRYAQINSIKAFDFQGKCSKGLQACEQL